VRAFRNSCSEAPHILMAAPGGHLDVIPCAVHGLQFELDGRRRGAGGAADLTALDVRLVGDLILVRAADRRRLHAAAVDPWTDFLPPADSRPIAAFRDVGVDADWKLVIEQWLELAARATVSAPDANSWSARSYRRLVGAAATMHAESRFVAPNHLIEVRGDGFTVRQALPVGPGRSVLRQHDFTLCEPQRPAQAAAYLASRLNPYTRRTTILVAESTQQGIVAFGHAAADGARAAPAVAQFRRQLLVQAPMMALARAPNDL
jgi:phenylpropionate dioxygenase-like ring-hydroxylating dioxygenase large terminal subunit